MQDPNIPEPPPPPAPYVLTLDDGVVALDEEVNALTATALQRIQLQHREVAPREKPVDQYDAALSLAVKKRAARQMDPGLIDRAKEVGKRVDEIRFLRTLAEQAKLVDEALQMERELEKGGPDALRAANFPAFDVAQLDSLLKRDMEVHKVLMASRKALQEDRLDAAATCLSQMTGCSTALEHLRKNNTERFGLHLRVDQQEEARCKYTIQWVARLLEEGLRKMGELETQRAAAASGSKPRFGAQYGSTKATSLLKTGLSWVKQLGKLYKNSPDWAALEKLAERAVQHIEGNSLSGSDANLSLSSSNLKLSSHSVPNGASTSSALPAQASLPPIFDALLDPSKVTSMSRQDLESSRDSLGNSWLHAVVSNEAHFASLKALLQHFDHQDALPWDNCNARTGFTPLHVATPAAIVELFKFPSQIPSLQRALSIPSKIDGDTPISALCKRCASLKDKSLLSECVRQMHELCPEVSSRKDQYGRTPLETLALKLWNQKPDTTSTSSTDGVTPVVTPMGTGFSFERYFLSPLLSDVEFELDDGKRVPAHRIVLAVQSPVLRALLEENQFAENASKNIRLLDCDEETVHFVFKYFYSGTVTLQAKQEVLAAKALALADKWIAADLVRQLSQRLMTCLSFENCFLIVEATEWARSCREETSRLRLAASAFLLKHYVDVLAEHDPDRTHMVRAIESLVQ